MKVIGTRFITGLAVGALAAYVVTAAFFDLLWTTRSWDAHVLLHNAERIVELGGPWYETAAEQKGPLWTAFYVVAYAIGGPFNAWFVIAAMVIGVALCTGAVVAHVGRLAGAGWPMASAVGAAAAIWLMLGPEEYSQVLFSRTIVGLLEVTAFGALLAIVVRGRAQPDWRRLLLAGAAGFLIGLAVQTNLASAPTGVVFGAFVLWIDLARPSARAGPLKHFPTLAMVFTLTAAAAFGSAIAFFAVRGGLEDFVDLWWTYNRDYAAATGLAIQDAVWKGLNDLWRYYQNHPQTFIYGNVRTTGAVLSAIIAGFILDAWRRRIRREPVAVDAFVVLWWLATWLAVALSTRLLPHYMALPFVPVAVMGVLLAARHLPRSGEVHLIPPAFVVLLILFTMGGPRLTAGIDRLAAFERPSAHRADVVASLPPARQELRHVVHNYSPPGSFVYAWTNEPMTYTDLERRSPTRYVEQRWLVGEIYGAPSPDPDYIPAGAWEKWAADMRATPPVLWIELDPYRPPAGSPAETLRDCAFTEIYAAPGQRVLARTSRSIGACLGDAGV
jgi:hypothetical protein